MFLFHIISYKVFGHSCICILLIAPLIRNKNAWFTWEYKMNAIITEMISLLNVKSIKILSCKICDTIDLMPLSHLILFLYIVQPFPVAI